jgi:PKD repeat protein/pimeloyl-ACP methyl ester carboxylesterase
MTIFLKKLLIVGLLFVIGRNVNGQTSSFSTHQKTLSVRFTENKGQVASIQGIPQSKVLFTAHAAGVKIFITENGIHYQFCKIFNPSSAHQNKKYSSWQDDSVQLIRLDMKLLNSRKPTSIIREQPGSDIENFYLSHCPNGILGVMNFGKIIFKNVYEGIDWILYTKNGQLEYDFDVQAGADFSQIRLQYEGAEKMGLDNEGNLIVTTLLGEVKEKKPISYQGGKEVPSSFMISGNTIHFKVSSDPRMALRIDPNIIWSTYYGGNNYEECFSTQVGSNGNAVIAGNTYSSSGLATGTSFQTVLRGFRDAFLASFNTNGQRLWATYYGGSAYETGASCAVDKTNSIYLCGTTNSPANIATTGSHQSEAGGVNDAFLVKFNSNGVRQWGTYYGGAKNESGFSCSADSAGNIYLSGSTASTNRIFSNGAQSSLGGSTDGFLVKFSSSGVRQWGTYYGGLGFDYGYSCCVRSNGTVYLGGTTTSTNAIATVNGFQTSLSGPSDAFLVKFNTSGQKQWGTYIGGDNVEDGLGTSIDNNGNVFLTGLTESSTGLASGGFQNIYQNNSDAFLAAFNTNGSRLWCSYYGGPGYDISYSCTTDSLGSITICGTTYSNSGISAGGFQGTIRGDVDAFAAKFSSQGDRIWGSYFGGGAYDFGHGIAAGSSGNLYLSGYTTSATNIASGGGFQNTLEGVVDAFLLKINDRNVSNISFYNQVSISKPAFFLDSATTDMVNLNPIRICADGSSATFVNYYNNDANVLINNISFRIKEDPTVANPNTYGFFSAPTNFSTAPQIRRCVFNHPSFLNNGSTNRSITIQVIDSSTNTILEEYPVTVFKAPIILLHGLYGNAEIFRSFQDNFLFASGASLYPGTSQNSPFVLRVNYNYDNGIIANNSIIKVSIDRLLDQMIRQKYSTGKVDILAHSMGALLSRAYIQDPYNIEPYRGDVHKLITLNGMHAGSQFADCAGQPNSDCALWAIVQQYLEKSMPVVSAGLAEVGTQSEVVDSLLNSYTVSRNNQVPTAAVATTISGVVRGASEPCAGVTLALQNLNIFGGEQNDDIVALSSQQGNISPVKSVNTSCHENSPNTVSVRNLLGTLINQNTTSANFDLDGYSPLPLVYTPVVVPAPVGSQIVNITSPADGATVTPGQVLNISATGSSLTKRMELYIGNEFINTTSFDTTTNFFTYSYTIPASSVGRLRMMAVGRDSVNRFVFDTLSVRVVPSAILDSVRTHPAEIVLPQYMSASFEVLGYYSDGQVRNLSSLPDISYNINNGAIASRSTGTNINGLTADTTSILIGYLGKTHRVPIRVLDGRDYQRAAFFVHDTLVCPGMPARFTNTSTGNVSSYLWTFESGSPASSTAVNPIVTYAANGKYDVTLVTTFTNGVKDTLYLKNYITVGGTVPNNPPSISVTAGKTKVCPGDTTQYTLNTVFNATSYFWVAPTGGLIISGQGTETVRVAYGSGFIADDSIRAQAINKCGVSSFKAVSVKRNEPSTPSTITGQKDGLCNVNNIPYSVNFVDSTVFNWRFLNSTANIASGQGTNNITANYGGSFSGDSLQVSAQNGCSTSAFRSLFIKPAPVQPAAITGAVTVCTNQQAVPYSCEVLAGASSYTWTAPSGARISDGITTSTTNSLTTPSNSVTVNFATSSGNITVRGVNTCAAGFVRSLAVTVNNCLVHEYTDMLEVKASSLLSLYPNPARDIAVLRVESSSSQLHVLVRDMSGRIVWQKKTAPGTILIPVSNISGGQYSVTVISNEESRTIKLMVVK